MSINIIQERLNNYNCQSFQEQENALKEITQEIALYLLYNEGFFKVAAFQGGTCLRIFYSLNRFSEDLDFTSLIPKPGFNISKYASNLARGFKAFGYDVEIVNRSNLSDTVQKVFIKADSIGKILRLTHRKIEGRAKAIRIKFEIDTMPPKGAKFESKFHDFPVNFIATMHDLPSLFAGKSHAILCREYLKGRDWYDFLWYASRKMPVNYELLTNALNQNGPWKDKDIKVDDEWYFREIEKKIRSTNWNEAKTEVARFLNPSDIKSLDVWCEELFLQSLDKLRSR